MRAACVTVTLLVASTALPVPSAAQGPGAPPAAPQRTIQQSPPLTIPNTTTFLGGIPTGPATGEVVTISVIDAIRRAIDHNLGVLTAEQGVNRAGGTRWRALAELLPNVNARVSETRQTINLAAFGFGSSVGSPFVGIPSIVGPFNVFDARILLSQSILDFGATDSARSASHSAEAARNTFTSARNFVIHVAGNLYIQALAAAARAEAAQAQRLTAQTLHTQALDLKQSGMIAGIDVLRAEVELNAQSQRTSTAANDAEKAKLQLARAIGLPLGQRFRLDPNLPELPDPDQTLEQAVETAYRNRPDYLAQLERVKAAELARRSIQDDHLPSLRVNADYGAIGLTPSEAQATFGVSAVVDVPIFNGGRTRGQLAEAEADLRSRRDEADDMKAAIFYEVQTAFLDLQTTREQLSVATKARDLAAQQLVQARDRFAAGVASNIEVVQAQEAVAVASEQYISSKYGYDLAKGALIRGTGTSEMILRQITGGSR